VRSEEAGVDAGCYKGFEGGGRVEREGLQEGGVGEGCGSGGAGRQERRGQAEDGELAKFESLCFIEGGEIGCGCDC
jgi:hypothetical protein